MSLTPEHMDEKSGNPEEELVEDRSSSDLISEVSSSLFDIFSQSSAGHSFQSSLLDDIELDLQCEEDGVSERFDNSFEAFIEQNLDVQATYNDLKTTCNDGLKVTNLQGDASYHDCFKSTFSLPEPQFPLNNNHDIANVGPVSSQGLPTLEQNIEPPDFGNDEQTKISLANEEEDVYIVELYSYKTQKAFLEMSTNDEQVQNYNEPPQQIDSNEHMKTPGILPVQNSQCVPALPQNPESSGLQHLDCNSQETPFSTQLVGSGTVISNPEVIVNIVCNLCDINFSCLEALTTHNKDRHRIKEESPTFDCMHCGETFTNKKALFKHRKIHKPRKAQAPQPNHNKSLGQRVHLKEHSKVKHDPIREKVKHDPNREKVKLDPKREKVNFDPNREKVNLDPNREEVRYDPNREKVRYDPNREKVKHDPKREKVKLDPNRENYHCSKCSFSCLQLRTLNLHIQKHEKEPKFACDQCGKLFHSMSILKRHAHTHSKLRPYHCIVSGCDKSFKIKSRLTDHIRTVHNKTKRKEQKNYVKNGMGAGNEYVSDHNKADRKTVESHENIILCSEKHEVQESEMSTFSGVNELCCKRDENKINSFPSNINKYIDSEDITGPVFIERSSILPSSFALVDSEELHFETEKSKENTQNSSTSSNNISSTEGPENIVIYDVILTDDKNINKCISNTGAEGNIEGQKNRTLEMETNPVERGSHFISTVFSKKGSVIPSTNLSLSDSCHNAGTDYTGLSVKIDSDPQAPINSFSTPENTAGLISNPSTSVCSQSILTSSSGLSSYCSTKPHSISSALTVPSAVISTQGSSTDFGTKSRAGLCEAQEKKRFACTWEGCGKTFRDGYNLRNHLCTHTKDMQRACPFCGYRCIQKSHLDKHMKTHSKLGD